MHNCIAVSMETQSSFPHGHITGTKEQGEFLLPTVQRAPSLKGVYLT